MQGGSEIWTRQSAPFLGGLADLRETKAWQATVTAQGHQCVSDREQDEVTGTLMGCWERLLGAHLGGVSKDMEGTVTKLSGIERWNTRLADQIRGTWRRQ